MCLVCVEYGKGKLKFNEAFKNLGEIKELIGDEHYDEVYSSLVEKEAEEGLQTYYDDFDSRLEESSWELNGFGD